MSTSIPDQAWKTYVLAIVFLTPAFIVWLFADVFLSSTLDLVWKSADLTGSRPQWLMASADFFIDNGKLIILAIVLIFLFLEYRVSAWPRYRRIALMCVAFIFNASVLIGMADFSTLALLVAKTLMKSH